MALLSDLALTPEVLCTHSYESGAEARAYLSVLARLIQDGAVVRDLHGGRWGEHVKRDLSGKVHGLGKHLVKQMKVQGRLVRDGSCQARRPVTDVEWCREALASNEAIPLNRVIASLATKQEFGAEPLVAPVSGMDTADFWKPYECSVSLKRDVAEYVDLLKPILGYAGKVKFVDPYLDPQSPNYSRFAEILRKLSMRKPAPEIEIHRRRRPNRPKEEGKDWVLGDWASRFRKAFEQSGLDDRMQIRLVLWSSFHDRFLLTDLIGIQMSNGFDERRQGQRSELTVWSRMSLDVKRAIEQSFNWKQLSGAETCELWG